MKQENEEPRLEQVMIEETARVYDNRGKLCIPRSIRNYMDGLEEGDEVEFRLHSDGTVTAEKVEEHEQDDGEG